MLYILSTNPEISKETIRDFESMSIVVKYININTAENSIESRQIFNI